MGLDLSKFLARFAEEAREHLSRMNEGLVVLEKNPEDTEVLNAVFRSAHTLKGSSRLMKLTAIAELAHRIEDALEGLREKRIPPSEALSSLLFSGVDLLEAMVEQAACGKIIDVDTETVSQALKEAAAAGPPMPGPPPAPIAAGAPREPSGAAKPHHSDSIRIDIDRVDHLIKQVEVMRSIQARMKRRFGEIRDLERTAARNLDLRSKSRPGSPLEPFPEALHSDRELHQSLERLASDLKEDVTLHDLLIGELQENALGMRMLPLSIVFDSLPRTFRDLSKSLEKKVNLVIEGSETRLDKKIIEKIGDPIVHMIRNAIDHGIEPPEERLKAGKNPEGTIHLSADCEGESVRIRLSDDGAGIPVKKIKEKLLKQKTYDEPTLETLTHSEIVNAIFQPGFSTSALITDLSGRGVGMDVVKENIVDELKGSIHIETRESEGTTFQIRLPLSLTIMHVVFIRVSDLVLAVPGTSLSEIVKVPASEVIDIMDRKAIRLRERILPLAELGDLLKLPVKRREADQDLLVLIAASGNEELGLIADALLDEGDVLVKPLPAHMQKIRFVSGVTVSGENDLVNILHVGHLIESAKLAKPGTFQRPREEVAEPDKTVHILVIDDSVNTTEIEKSILEAYGYRVTVASDGMEALERAKEHHFDLIITDIEMPRMDGFSLTEALRKEEGYRDTPIILLTSRDKEEDKRRGIQVGASAYIVKGNFDQSNLLETVRDLV